jgi:hypothetical protein
LPNSGKSQVVKVKAFPIAAKLVVGSGPEALSGQILKLTPRGFLIEAAVPALKTGDKFTITFELPVLRTVVTDTCVVVKLYTSPGSQVLEGHFQSLSADGERAIMRFLASIPKAAES